MKSLKIKISTRLLAYFFFVTILPLAILALTSTLLLNSSLDEKLIQDLNIKSDYVWKNYNKSISEFKSVIYYSSSYKLKHLLKTYNNDKNAVQLNKELAHISNRNNLDLILIFDENKKLISYNIKPDTKSKPDTITKSSLDLESLIKLLKDNKIIISLETISIKDLLAMGVIPNNSDSGNSLGYLAQIGLTRINIAEKKYYFLAGQILSQKSDFFKDLKDTNETKVFITHSNNIYFSNLDQNTNSLNVLNNKLLINNENYKSAIFPLRNILGTGVGKLIIAIPEQYFDNLKLKNSTLLFKIALLIALAGITLSYVLARSISKPISIITEAARAIENGDCSRRVVIKSTDELGYLAESFNSMAVALQKRKELEQLKEDFVATLTHDLRVPLLANVQTLDYILKGSFGDLSEKLRFITQQLISNNKDLLNMVNTILDSHKYEAGKYNLVKGKVNLNKLIQESISEIESLANEKKQEINFAPYNDNIEIIADRQEIKRVFINLLGNAITYTQENGKIEIYTKFANDEIIVSIKDNGTGIPESSIKNIFDRYSKGAKTLRKVGTGLGLYLSKHIIEAHNGQIWVESIQNEGSTFHFSIPVRLDNNE